MAYYGLTKDEPRVGFDPKGFVSSAKQSQKLSSYEHVPIKQEDLIRNLDEVQAIDKLEAYDKITRAKEWKKNHNFVGIVLSLLSTSIGGQLVWEYSWCVVIDVN